MTDAPSGSVGAIVERAAAELGGVERTERGAVVEWSASGVPFATVQGDRAEFRLAGAIAAAALRTPDTASSVRGPDWVAFMPSVLDGHAIDRAEAWLASAWRRAVGS